MTTLHQIEALLPQTQCGQCGFAGCAPYAEALVKQEAQINLCPPGGRDTIKALAQLLAQPLLEPADPLKTDAAKVLAVIDEQECIGCTACIKACPVDAIVGATKFMHDVIALECTGCGLCVPPCPVDCIDLVEVADAFLPRVSIDAQITSQQAAAHAKERFELRNLRLEKLERRKQAERIAKREAMHKAKAEKEQQQQAATAKPAFDPFALIAKASANAQAQKKVEVKNQSEHVEEQIQAAIDAAAIRQAVRDIEFGSESEKQAAIQLLRQQKQRRKQRQQKS